jgi:AcrR family transcriptional regulator
MPPIVSDEYKEKKRKEILASAFACFAKKGFEAATIDDIVAHSGISKGAIYNYFTSKDDIYLELMRGETHETSTELLSKISEFHTAFDKISYLFDVYIAIDPFEENNSKDVIVHYEFKIYSSRNKDVNSILNQRKHEFFIKLISDILEEGKSNGEVNEKINPRLYADLFWSMLDGATIQTLYKDYPYHDVIKEMKDIYLNRILTTKK